ncbi:hypothetical protein F5X99DRAFT_402185 [Biscogniauxia marginata]|nr:hypothetical protein F5X99DRAFT_402185 [Biscogniauxia marginata]
MTYIAYVHGVMQSLFFSSSFFPVLFSFPPFPHAQLIGLIHCSHAHTTLAAHSLPSFPPTHPHSHTHIHIYTHTHTLHKPAYMRITHTTLLLSTRQESGKGTNTQYPITCISRSPSSWWKIRIRSRIYLSPLPREPDLILRMLSLRLPGRD